jgi:hypothetical protein
LFSLSWPECGRTGAFQAVQFSSMSTDRDKWIGGSEVLAKFRGYERSDPNA